MIDPTAPAYPVAREVPVVDSGLTIRAEFAKAAMQGFIVALGMGYHGAEYSTLTQCSLDAADALIAALNKGEKE